MKNKIIIMLLLLSVPFSSCSDWLDIKPLDSMVLEDYWKTQSDVESVVLTCYKAMIETGYIERVILSGEVRSDNIVAGRSTPAGLTKILEATILPSNDYAKWEPFYKVINYCNTVLKFAPGVTELDPDYTNGLLKAHEAEALTLRALTYFYLARMYREFPYITDPYIDDTQNFYVEATQGSKVLDYLIEDLLIAEKYAVKSKGNKYQVPYYAKYTNGRINKNAVRALLADIYLWKGEYSACIEMCDKILEDVIDPKTIISAQMLTGAEMYLTNNDNLSFGQGTSYEVFLSKNSSESIFELQFDRGDNQNTKVHELYGDNMTLGQLSATPLVGDYDVFGDLDVRGKDYIDPNPVGYAGFYQITKYRASRTPAKGTEAKDFYNYTNYTSSTYTPNWIIYRLADAYLMKAEALVQRNAGMEDLEEALEMVNITYMRSNPDLQLELSINDYSSKESMEELVMLERQREFVFEGKRWFDLLRMAEREGSSTNMLNKYLMRKYTLNPTMVQTKLSNMDALYMPIHKKELSANPKLKQNPYYNTLKD
ncbi:RagB/SusD family nutrient uptake outer membrane protein [Bacteroidales bacterium OttesenSCG-928-M11]|nr:RagB/SusD family nutrient uptake outer membrane protein [Bacteroidales bacterium OttesenSCG-928-M11]